MPGELFTLNSLDMNPKFQLQKQEFNKICYMLRISPESVDKKIVTVYTIGLPNKMPYHNKKYFQIEEQYSAKLAEPG